MKEIGTIIDTATETKIHPSDVNKIIEKVNKLKIEEGVFDYLLSSLLPYIKAQMCRVRLLTPTDDPSITLKQFSADGYEPIQFYELFKYPELRKGAFKDVILIVIFKRKEDIKMEQLTGNLK